MSWDLIKTLLRLVGMAASCLPAAVAAEDARQRPPSSAGAASSRSNTGAASDTSSTRTLRSARWGLIPHWWKRDRPPGFSINARLEEVSGKPMWRDPIRRSRCLLPAEGWYEWRAAPGGRQPYYITRRDRRPFCFAGLYASWRETLSCALLTTQALGPIAAVHERMPVVLPEEDHAAWLEPAMHDAAVASAMALEPMAPEEFEYFPVSRRVNDARHEGPDLIEPVRA